jgi:hypothetical protein
VLRGLRFDGTIAWTIICGYPSRQALVAGPIYDPAWRRGPRQGLQPAWAGGYSWECSKYAPR